MIAFNYRMHYTWGLLSSLVVAEALHLPVNHLTIFALLLVIRLRILWMIGALIAAYYTMHDQSWLFLLGVFIGFGAPDFDAPGSWFGRRTLGISWVINKCLMLLGSLINKVRRRNGRFFAHRTYTHSFIIVLGLMALLAYLRVPLAFLVSFSISYLSHILGDMMWDPGEKNQHSPGVALFWPSLKRYRFNWAYKHPQLVLCSVVAVPLALLIFINW